MIVNGIFEGKILGAGTNLRADHTRTAAVLSVHGKDLIVAGTKKFVVDVADATLNHQIGDVWMQVNTIGGITVQQGWMAVKYHGTAIVTLTVDLPDAPPVPIDKVVVASLTLDFNATHEIVGMWVNNGQEWIPYVPPVEPPVG